MKSWGFVFLGVAFALAGCGKPGAQNSSLPTFEVPVLDADREDFLLSFPLLDEHEEEAAPRDPITQKSPFGVLIHMSTFGKGRFCSLAHVSPGIVTTNAHCVEHDSHPENYFVVFYNQQNWKKFTRVSAFEYVGNSNGDDIAVLRIPKDASDAWDTIGGKAVESQNEVSRLVPVLHKVVVWSFNPFSGNHPELAEKYRGPGMRFTPRHCNASRTEPRITGITLDEAGEVADKTRILSRARAKMHWFVDKCDRRPVQGNSGSLITSAQNISEAMGVFHWLIPYDSEGMKKFNYFDYAGNDNEEQVLSVDDLKKRDFFGVGTDFAYILGFKPGWF